MSIVIIKHATTGEVQSVFQLEGYDETEWEVLAIDREPLPNEAWDETNGVWVLDEARAAQQDELAEMTNKERHRQRHKTDRQRINQLIDAVQALQARVDILEGN